MRRNLFFLTASFLATMALVASEAGLANEVAYTGCLGSAGVLHAVAEGSEPLRACRHGWKQITWNQTGPAGPQGKQGPPGPATGIERVRYDFFLPAGALPPDKLSETSFEPEDTLTGLSGTLTLSEIPPDCIFVDVLFNAVLADGPPLATWFDIITPGGSVDIPADGLSTQIVEDNPHPQNGLLEVDVLCFGPGRVSLPPGITPAVSGSVILEVSHAPRLIQ